MAEHSYPFDSSSLNEAQWSRMAASWQTNGVDAPGPWDQALKVVATGQPFQLLVTAGHAKCAGFHYEMDANTVVLFEENKTTSSRTDRVVLRLNRETNTVAVKVKKGGMEAPPVDRSWDTLEVPLATFIVRANSDTVAPADLADVREFVSSGVQMLPATSGSGVRQLSEGQFGYSPAAGKFFAQEKGRQFEVGTQPDLSPYLTKSSAATLYAAKTHQHSLVFTSTSVSVASRIQSLQNVLLNWGMWSSISLIISPDASAGTIPSDSRIGNVTDSKFRPIAPTHITAYQQDNGGPSHGVARVTLHTNGDLVYAGSTEPWMANRWIHLYAAYLSPGYNPW